MPVAGFEEKDAIAEFSSLRLERIHEQLCDTGASKVGPHPEPFHLTRSEIASANRAQSNATSQVSITACNEVATERRAQRVKISRHVVLN